MYSGKRITKEDTWREEDLMRHMEGLDVEGRRRHRTRRDSEREPTKPRDANDERKEKEIRIKEKERERDRYKDRETERGRNEEKHKERERDKNRERQKEKGKERERHRDKDKERERLRDRDERERHRDKDKERERHRDRDERERHRDKDKERERHRDRDERERHRDRDERERHRDKDKERERHSDRDERERHSDRDERERHSDRDERERHRDKDKERERHSDRDERERHRDKDKERERHRDKDKERERHSDRDERERHRDKDKERERRSDRDERERHRDKDKERERLRSEREAERSKGKHRRTDKERERNPREKDHQRERAKEQEARKKREQHAHRESNGRTERDKRRESSGKDKGRNEDGETRRAEHRRLKEKNSGDQKHSRTEQEVSPEIQRRSSRAYWSDPKVPVESDDVGEEAEGYGSQEYQEDFEDYEEDFEELTDVDEKEETDFRDLSPRSRREIEAIRRAMEKENELVGESRSRSSTTTTTTTTTNDSEPVHKGRSRGIDFRAARRREVTQHAAEQQKKRGAELLRLIDLDLSVTETLLDLAPVSEYDLYIKSFGSANTAQVYVQCHEDNAERDTQTEDTDSADKWTQHPAETNLACGGPRISQNASEEPMIRTSVDSKRLTEFLRAASQVMAVLLEENVSESCSVVKAQSQASTYSFSDGCVQLNTQCQLLHGRRVTLLHFSQTQTHTLLSVHAPSSRRDDTLASKTIICVWNIWEPSIPQKTLVYEAEVRSCCFSPGKATLVFAGTSVGSVVLWDLREPSGSHWRLPVAEEEWTLRYPTFSTDAVLSGAGHLSPVLSLEPVPVAVGAGLTDPLLPDEEESLGLSFQLGSMDESGLLNLWVVAELPKADDSGSQTDLGLRPGGRVKLLLSSSVQTAPPGNGEVTGVTSHPSFVLKFHPSDSSRMFIGRDLGLVQHETRHGLRATPKLFRPARGERPAEVTALEFCPSGDPFFLVGCSDGSVRLHSLLRKEAVCEWTVGGGGVSVRSVRLNPTRPTMFYVLDSASVLHVWDLAERDDSPVISEDLHADPVTAVAAFGETARRRPYSGVALAKASGRLEIVFLKASLTLPSRLEREKLHSLVQESL